MSKIDYDIKKLRAVVLDVDGVLSPATVPLNDEGIPRRMANLRDGFALKTAVDAGFGICIITGGNDPAIKFRYEGLGIKDVMMVSGDKLPYLKEWMINRGFTPEEVAYVGDDVPDLACMRYVGLAVAPSDAAIDALMVANYVTDAIGGYGVARELLEQILRVKSLWPSDSRAFGK